MKISTEGLKATFDQAIKFGSRNLPTIMIGLGIGGFIVTVVEATRAGIKAKEAIEEAEEEKGDKLTKKEKTFIIVKKSWRAFLEGILSIFLICYAHKISLKRQAVLGAAYAVAINDLDEYKDKVTEILGESKAEKVKESIAADKISTMSIEDIPIAGTPGNTTLYYFAWTHTPFRSNQQAVEQVRIDLNDDMYRAKGHGWLDGEVKLNDLIYELSTVAAPGHNLGPVALGDQLGFSPTLTGPIDYDMTYTKAANGEPCAVINVKPQPLEENLRKPFDY